LVTGAPKVSFEAHSGRRIARDYHFEAFSTFFQPNLLTSPLQKNASIEDFSALHELTGLAPPRVIYVLFVITTEEAELLLAMGGVIGGIHIEDDHLQGAGWVLRYRSIRKSESRRKSLAVARFSNRDRVGCEARSSPLSGALPAMILRAGSWESQAASLLSS
jgi:hypothetical protein